MSRRFKAVAARTLAVVATLSVTLMAMSVPAAAEGPKPLTKRPKTQVERSVTGENFTPSQQASANRAAISAKSYKVADRFPQATDPISTVLPGAGQWVSVEDTPVWLGHLKSPEGSATLSQTPTGTVELLSQTVTEQAGVTGILFKITPPGNAAEDLARSPALTGGNLRTAKGTVRGDLPVRVSYAAFKDAVGGDWASRLQLMTVPLDCASDRTQVAAVAACGLEPVPTKNNRTSLTLTARVSLASTGATLVAAAPLAAGDQGDFAATPLAASTEWSVGLQTGNFAWNYPIPTAPVPSGLTPDVGISYSSQSVDGRTQGSNNQTSWLGEGQELGSGFIERNYVACADSQAAGNQTGDLCWKTDNATLNFQGQSSQLVRIPGGNEWRAKDDEGWRVRRLTDTTPGNGDNDGEYWELTDQDGTRYYFGKERRFAGDTSTTGSTWTVPVFGDDDGEPCHDTTIPTSFAASWCQQAWRWNLDYVVDVHNNTMTYVYAPETNRYGLNNNASQPLYTRGGYLTRIDYGQVAGLEDTVAAAARVDFVVAERCLPDATFDCDPTKLNAANASNWPDVPFDQICESTTNCSGNKSPTFFSRKRLVQIKTQVLSGTGFATTDRFDFTHLFPQAGDSTGRSLWLDSISRTGLSGPSITTPPVIFDGIQMPNRVLIDGAQPLIKWRVRTINTETGGTITVTYSAPDCGLGNMPASPSTNQKRCFPAYWQQTDWASPIVNWFHKYVVTQVTESDKNGTVTPINTFYTYTGGGAWHYDDNELTKPKYRTYGQWRGYNTVEVETGDSTEVGTTRSYDKYLYLRGMHGDQLPDGPDPDTLPDKRSVSVTDSEGVQTTDLQRYNGFLREHITKNGAGGEVVSAQINDPWLSPATANDGTDTAHILRTEAVHTRKQLVGTTNYVRSTVTTTYDDYGLQATVHDAGNDSITTDSTCTTTTYNRNTDRWMLALVKRVQTVKLNCDQAPNLAVDLVSGKQFSYDNRAYGDAVTATDKGDLTREETYSGTLALGSWKTTSQLTYDARGRVTAATDGENNTTTTTYQPTGTGATQLGPLTQQTTTNPYGHAVVTTFDPSRGQPLAITDANGKKTTATYDALGRVTAIWHPGRTQGIDTPHEKFDYNLTNQTHSNIASQRLLNDGTYVTSFDIYDAFLRPVESQTPSVANETDRVLTTTRYDSRGQRVQELGPYTVAASAPTGVYYSPSVVQVAKNHRYVFDGAGRTSAAIYQPNNTEAWRTTTSYDANRVLTDPPVGGTPTTDVFDVRGQKTQHIEHLGASPAVTTTQTTTYTYDPAGRMKTMTDPLGDLWAWTYDLRGNQTTIKDPDKGTTTATFDNNDRELTTTDARGKTLLTSYDKLGRTVALYDGGVVDLTKLRAKWEYDTVAAGQLTKATRYLTPGDTTTAIVEAVTGYTDRYQPTGTSTTIPAITGTTDTLAGTYTTTSTYNQNGSLKTKVLPAVFGLGAESITYAYTRLGLPTTMGGTFSSLVNDSVYSPYGELLQMTMGATSGKFAFQTWYLDAGTRRTTRHLVSAQAVTGSIDDTNYLYDQAGNITRLADAAGTADIQCFTYDFRRQLKESWTINTGACGTTPSQTVMGTTAGAYWTSYTYDALGNRKTKVEHPKTGANTTYTYTYTTPGATTYPNPTTGAGGPHAVSTVSKKVGTATPTTTTYKYDAAGNMTTRGTYTHTWDNENKLSTSKNGTTAASTNLYNADGARILRIDPDGTKTLYLDSTETKLTGTTKTSQRWYQFGGQTFASRTTAGLQILTSDHHGTGQTQINAATAAVVKRRFDPFGAQRGGGTTPANWVGDHGFLDKPTDTNSGLTQIGARFYDPTLGRFISVDPLLDPNDTHQANAYTYVANNPLTFTDPTGLRCDPSPTEPCPTSDATGGGGGGGDGGGGGATGGTGSGGGGGGQGVTNSPPITSPTATVLREALKTVTAVFAPFVYANVMGPWIDPGGRHLSTHTRSSQRANNAHRLLTGADIPRHRRGVPLWAKPDWEKLSGILNNKWVRRTGYVGAALGVVSSFSEHKEAGDTNTEAALKTSVEAGLAAGGAAFGATLGAGCTVGAAICSTVLGGLGAYAGGALGSAFTSSEVGDAAIGWTAGKIDAGVDAAQDVDWTFWN